MKIKNMDIFSERESVQPYHYPKLIDFSKAIQRSFWTSEHFDYAKDVRDFGIDLNEIEQEAVKRAMLAIGVIENKVKTFWAHLDLRMPCTEVADAGMSMAGSEVIHRQSYEELLNQLNLQDAFEDVLEVDCMKNRAKYLKKYLSGMSSRSNKEFTKSLILFTLLIEDGSLMTQFLTISSFNKYKNKLTNFSSIINATAREEQLHSNLGIYLINIIKSENPEWFDDDMENKIRRNIRKAFKSEEGVLDWIFEKGELDFISKYEVLEYLKSRFNTSLNKLGYENEFKVKPSLLKKSEFMDIMLKATPDFDFFSSQNSNYNLNNSYTEDSLW